MTKIWNCLLKPPSRGNRRKVFLPGHNRMARVGFEPRPCHSQSLRLNYLTMLSRNLNYCIAAERNGD